MGRLQGKTALVTGGTTGIGLATAKLFLAEGARVAITGQNPDRLRTAQAELGPEVLVLRADVASRPDMAEVGRILAETFGTLDVVFANAGIFQAVPLEAVTDEILDSQVGVNIKGIFHTVQAVLPILANPASIVLTGSTVDSQGYPGMSVYAATKAAVRSLARSLSAELVGRGVRVNVVAPGPIETPIWTKSGLPQEILEGMSKGIVEQIPIHRFGKPEEVARAVLFLASDDSSYVLGESLLVDGGSGTI